MITRAGGDQGLENRRKACRMFWKILVRVEHCLFDPLLESWYAYRRCLDYRITIEHDLRRCYEMRLKLTVDFDHGTLEDPPGFPPDRKCSQLRKINAFHAAILNVFE